VNPEGRVNPALHAEWTKLRTLPGTAGLLLAVVVATVAVSTAAAATISCPAGDCGVDPARVSLTGVQLGQAVVAILAVLVIGGEYATGMVHTTLTAMPRRTTVLAAKTAVLTGLVTAAATVGVVGSLLAGRLILPRRLSPSLSDGAVLRAVAGSILYLALIAVLALGVATAVRNSATAIGIVLGLLYVFPIIAQAASDPVWRRHLRQAGPMTAGLAIQATTGLDTLPIGPWPGLAVLAAWSAAALITGGLLLHLRDA
jgi:ABC-2 type transport system permease protein